MNSLLQRVIEALRDELQQYGEMLALLDQQQELFGNGQSAELAHSVIAVTTQNGCLEAVRGHRERVQQELARRLRQPDNASFARLVPLVPEAYRPLIRALLQENGELLQRIGDRAHQNHLLLQRSLSLMQGVLHRLDAPDSAVPPVRRTALPVDDAVA
jgi:hypothetical protein